MCENIPLRNLAIISTRDSTARLSDNIKLNLASFRKLKTIHLKNNTKMTKTFNVTNRDTQHKRQRSYDTMIADTSHASEHHIDTIYRNIFKSVNNQIQKNVNRHLISIQEDPSEHNINAMKKRLRLTERDKQDHQTCAKDTYHHNNIKYRLNIFKSVEKKRNFNDFYNPPKK